MNKTPTKLSRLISFLRNLFKRPKIPSGYVCDECGKHPATVVYGKGCMLCGQCDQNLRGI